FFISVVVGVLDNVLQYEPDAEVVGEELLIGVELLQSLRHWKVLVRSEFGEYRFEHGFEVDGLADHLLMRIPRQGCELPDNIVQRVETTVDHFVIRVIDTLLKSSDIDDALNGGDRCPEI